MALNERINPCDQDIFNRLFDQHKERLLRYCQQFLAGKEDAEDAVVQSGANAWKYCEKFQDVEANYIFWLMKIARHVCIDISRKHSRLPSQVSIENNPEFIFMQNKEPTPEQETLSAQFLEELIQRAIRMIQSWDEVDSLILGYRYGPEELEFNEIAQRLNWNVVTVRWRHHTRIKRLFAQIRREHDEKKAEASNAKPIL